MVVYLLECIFFHQGVVHTLHDNTRVFPSAALSCPETEDYARSGSEISMASGRDSEYRPEPHGYFGAGADIATLTNPPPPSGAPAPAPWSPTPACKVEQMHRSLHDDLSKPTGNCTANAVPGVLHDMSGMVALTTKLLQPIFDALHGVCEKVFHAGYFVLDKMGGLVHQRIQFREMMFVQETIRRFPRLLYVRVDLFLSLGKNNILELVEI